MPILEWKIKIYNCFFKSTLKSTIAIFWTNYAFFLRNNQNLQCPFSNGPPTFGDFSPTLGGPPSLRSTIMSSRSNPSVLVRPSTLWVFGIFSKLPFSNGPQNLQWYFFYCSMPFSNQKSKSTMAFFKWTSHFGWFLSHFGRSAILMIHLHVLLFRPLCPCKTSNFERFLYFIQNCLF